MTLLWLYAFDLSFIIQILEEQAERKMPEINCESCGAVIAVAEDYKQPYLKCAICGGHQKAPDKISSGPIYKILDDSSRARTVGQTLDLEALDEQQKKDDELKKRTAPAVAAPVIASRANKNVEPQRVVHDFKEKKRVYSGRRDFQDALGENGYELLLQLVAGYMGELNEKKRLVARGKAVQKLMKSKVPAELASAAVEFAEKSPEIEEILWSDYKSAMFRGLGIFAVGIVLSVVIHLLAHPRWEFVLFQVPFAVGFAYAVNAGINMAGLRIPALRSEKVHYLFMALSILLIGLYAIVGIWY